MVITLSFVTLRNESSNCDWVEQIWWQFPVKGLSGLQFLFNAHHYKPYNGRHKGCTIPLVPLSSHAVTYERTSILRYISKL